MSEQGKTLADLRTEIDLGFQVHFTAESITKEREDYIFRTDDGAYVYLMGQRIDGKPFVTIHLCASLDEILQAKNGMLHAPVWTLGIVPDDVMQWYHAGLAVMQREGVGGLFMEDNPLYISE